MAYETDLLEFGDIFHGSKALDALVAELKSEALAEIAAIVTIATGGAVKAVETGALKARLVESENSETLRPSSAASRSWSASTPSQVSESARRWPLTGILSTSLFRGG